jgi:hypothetical protein
MKHAEMAAHSSGRSGGDSRVLDDPLIGVLQIIATATVLKCIVPHRPGVRGRTQLCVCRKSRPSRPSTFQLVATARVN